MFVYSFYLYSQTKLINTLTIKKKKKVNSSDDVLKAITFLKWTNILSPLMTFSYLVPTHKLQTKNILQWLAWSNKNIHCILIWGNDLQGCNEVEKYTFNYTGLEALYCHNLQSYLNIICELFYIKWKMNSHISI